MEFNEKLQELRKRRGLTQEELAEALFVSRTAISKWESGRGFPNIESLKAISRYFSVSLDTLLSGEELLSIAENDHRRREAGIRDLVCGLLDCAMLLFLFLPLFGYSTYGSVNNITLLSSQGVRPALKVLYLSIVGIISLWGILILTLQNNQNAFWLKNKSRVSLVLGSLAVLVFIMTRQSYAAAFAFVLLIIKVFMLKKAH